MGQGEDLVRDYEAGLEYAMVEGVVGKRVGDDGGREFLVKIEDLLQRQEIRVCQFIYIYMGKILFSPLIYQRFII
jgi:hypothetical protein